MSQSRTLFIGMDGHKDAIAVASVAPDHGAEVLSLGPIGTRQWHRSTPPQDALAGHTSGLCLCSWPLWLLALPLSDEQRLRLLGGGPLTHAKKGRGPRHHRPPGCRATRRLARSGARTAVSVPTGEDAAMRDRSRAREETLGALQAATCRLTACFLRHAIRSTGRATWSPAPLRWLSAVVCPTPAQHSVFQGYCSAWGSSMYGLVG
jgi:transposase